MKDKHILIEELKQEHEELYDKFSKLNVFILENWNNLKDMLGKTHYALLLKQHIKMSDYLHILKKRVSLLESEDN